MFGTFYLVYLICFIVFLIAAFSFTLFNMMILKMGKFHIKENLKKSIFFFKKPLLKQWEKFYILFLITKNIICILFSISSFLLLWNVFIKSQTNALLKSGIICLIIILFFMGIELIIRIISQICKYSTLKITSFINSIYILILLIITYPFYKITLLILKKIKRKSKIIKSFAIKDKVLEMIKDSELNTILSSADQNTIASFITFKEKVAREIMVPRIDIFAIDHTTTIQNATKLLLEENYSRIPIYKDNLDNIIGVLMFKDLLKFYSKGYENKDILNQSIETIVKPIIYAPENKKISKLFQDFRIKKNHLAIIVNEYGGTEGIVTIEDILEEVVGEIKDEYDISEEKMYKPLPSGSFIIDAKMSIIDLEEKLNIKIPHSPEYETIGGYIFHVAGTIPSKGWKIHLEDLDIEILNSNERCIEKIRITPIRPKN